MLMKYFSLTDIAIRLRTIEIILRRNKDYMPLAFWSQTTRPKIVSFSITMLIGNRYEHPLAVDSTNLLSLDDAILLWHPAYWILRPKLALLDFPILFVLFVCLGAQEVEVVIVRNNGIDGDVCSPISHLVLVSLDDYGIVTKYRSNVQSFCIWMLSYFLNLYYLWLPVRHVSPLQAVEVPWNLKLIGHKVLSDIHALAVFLPRKQRVVGVLGMLQFDWCIRDSYEQSIMFVFDLGGPVHHVWVNQVQVIWK